MTFPIVILAGGASRRMGSRNKLLEMLQGHPLIRVQAMRALCLSDDVHVVIRPNSPELIAALDELDVHILETEAALEGIGGSLRAATHAMSQASHFLMILADLVEISTDDLRQVSDAYKENGSALIWRGATQSGKPGHPIVFHHKIYPDLLQLSGDNGGKNVMRKYADHVQHIPLPGKRARMDLDTPEAWDAWHASQDKAELSQ